MILNASTYILLNATKFKAFSFTQIYRLDNIELKITTLYDSRNAYSTHYIDMSILPYKVNDLARNDNKLFRLLPIKLLQSTLVGHNGFLNLLYS